MPYFVLNRNHPLQGQGHSINFIKGQKTWVPPALARDAVSIGAECVDEVIDMLDPEQVVEPELSAEERETLLFVAFDQMEARIGTSDEFRSDYNAQGLPNVKALEKIVGFLPDSKERNAAFQKHREAKAA